jgi:hypothetical protein
MKRHASRFPAGFTGHEGRLVPAPRVDPRDRAKLTAAVYSAPLRPVAYTTLTADDWVLAEPRWEPAVRIDEEPRLLPAPAAPAHGRRAHRQEVPHA